MKHKRRDLSAAPPGCLIKSKCYHYVCVMDSHPFVENLLITLFLVSSTALGIILILYFPPPLQIRTLTLNVSDDKDDEKEREDIEKLGAAVKSAPAVSIAMEPGFVTI